MQQLRLRLSIDLRIQAKRFFILLIFPLLLSGCGTFSSLRPADNLEKGEQEITVGLSANGIPEFLPVLKYTYGFTDWFELSGQYEVYSVVGEARFGLFHSEKDGFALAMGFQAGHVYFRDKSSIALGPTLTLGKRWELWEIYLSGRLLIDTKLVLDNAAKQLDTAIAVTSAKAGVRTYIYGPILLAIESGVSIHNPYRLTLWESAVALSLAF